ncbi:MAG: hypothetical protein NWR72_01980 [Bacteroidia bacterium]|nr:hypothetical protein [Bacteroidia bacterium]
MKNENDKCQTMEKLSPQIGQQKTKREGLAGVFSENTLGQSTKKPLPMAGAGWQLPATGTTYCTISR